MTTQHFKITAKSREILGNTKNTTNQQKTQSQKENDLRPMLVPATLTVSGTPFDDAMLEIHSPASLFPKALAKGSCSNLPGPVCGDFPGLRKRSVNEPCL